MKMSKLKLLMVIVTFSLGSFAMGDKYSKDIYSALEKGVEKTKQFFSGTNLMKRADTLGKRAQNSDNRFFKRKKKASQFWHRQESIVLNRKDFGIPKPYKCKLDYFGYRSSTGALRKAKDISLKCSKAIPRDVYVKVKHKVLRSNTYRKLNKML